MEQGINLETKKRIRKELKQKENDLSLYSINSKTINKNHQVSLNHRQSIDTNLAIGGNEMYQSPIRTPMGVSCLADNVISDTIRTNDDYQIQRTARNLESHYHTLKPSSSEIIQLSEDPYQIIQREYIVVGCKEKNVQIKSQTPAQIDKIYVQKMPVRLHGF